MSARGSTIVGSSSGRAADKATQYFRAPRRAAGSRAQKRHRLDWSGSIIERGRTDRTVSLCILSLCSRHYVRKGIYLLHTCVYTMGEYSLGHNQRKDIR